MKEVSVNSPGFLLLIENEGAEIIRTNYAESEYAQKGYFFLSVQAGALRLLVPPCIEGQIPEMRQGAKYVVASFLPEKMHGPKKLALELLFEDGSEDPYVLSLSGSQIDRLPSPEDVGIQLVMSIWSMSDGARKAFSLPAYIQIVPALPCLRRIE